MATKRKPTQKPWAQKMVSISAEEEGNPFVQVLVIAFTALCLVFLTFCLLKF